MTVVDFQILKDYIRFHIPLKLSKLPYIENWSRTLEQENILVELGLFLVKAFLLENHIKDVAL